MRLWLRLAAALMLFFVVRNLFDATEDLPQARGLSRRVERLIVLWKGFLLSPSPSRVRSRRSSW